MEGDLPPVVGEMAAACGTDAAGYVAEGPGLSAFVLSKGVVYHTYSTYARGLEVMLGFYPLVDRVAKGRDEEGDMPFWIRRHDEYEAAGAGTGGNALADLTLRGLASAHLRPTSTQLMRVAEMPPSTYRVIPWTMRASSEARNTTPLAMSSGSTTTPAGVPAVSWSSVSR